MSMLIKWIGGIDVIGTVTAAFTSLSESRFVRRRGNLDELEEGGLEGWVQREAAGGVAGGAVLWV